MKMRQILPILISASVFLPLKIEKFKNFEPKISVAQLKAYDPLTAEFIDFRKGMAILDSAGMDASYDTLYHRLAAAGFKLPYSPPKMPISPESIIFPVDIVDNPCVHAIKVERSERAYILYQLLTGRKGISRRGIDEIRYMFDKKIVFAGEYDNIDTLDIRYVFSQSRIACLEFATLLASILLSYGINNVEIHILMTKEGDKGHAFIKANGIIFDDEISGSEEAVRKYYKRVWGEYKDNVLKYFDAKVK